MTLPATTPKAPATAAKAPAVIEEGLRQRRNEVSGWMCVLCWHHMTFLSVDGSCANCKKKACLFPIKSRARLQEETDAALEKQRWKPSQEGFDPFDPASQMGKPLTHEQLLKVIRKFIPGTVMRAHYHPVLKRKLNGIYIPHRGSDEITQYLGEAEKKAGLRFVCNCEFGMMPEWDIMKKDDKGLPLAQVRGWRSVCGTLYRAGLMPHIPDGGVRKSNWEIRESPLKEKRF